MANDRKLDCHRLSPFARRTSGQGPRAWPRRVVRVPGEQIYGPADRAAAVVNAGRVAVRVDKGKPLRAGTRNGPWESVRKELMPASRNRVLAAPCLS